MHTRTISALFAAATIALVGAGCGGDNSEESIENLIESQTSDNVDVDVDEDGDLTIEGDNGDLTIEGGSEIPDEWPADVPQPTDMTATYSSVTEIPNGSLITVVGTTDQAAGDFLASYGAVLTAAGFESLTALETAGNFSNVFGTEDWTISVGAGPDPTGATAVSLTVAPSDS